MSKKSPAAPAAPDPVQTATAQTASNKETALWNAILNNVNQITPYGNLTYTQTAGADGQPPQFTSKIELTPEAQQIFDTQNRSDLALTQLGEQQLGRIGEAVSTPYSYNNLKNQLSEGDIMAQQLRGEEAMMSRMNPQFQRDEEALRTRLINQGIGQGSEAYTREMESFNQAKNDARTQAILSGQQYGGTAQQQALQRRTQEIDEYNAQRNAPLNEYIGMTSGVQVQNPTFSSAGYAGAAGTDIAGLTNQNYQNQMAQYNAKLGSKNNLTSSLFSLGGMAAGGFLGGPAGAAAGKALFG
jgi:hypothetical protein